MFGWGKRKRTAPDVQQQLQALRLERERMRNTLIQALASNPATLQLAVGMLDRTLGKALVGQQAPQDDFKALLLELWREERRRNPLEDGLRLISALRGAKEDLAELAGDGPEAPESDHLLVQLASPPAAVGLVQALGPVAAQFARAMQAVQAPMPAQTVQEVAAGTPALDQPPADQPPVTLTPERVLAELEGRSPDDAARRTLELAQASPELRQVLEQALALPRPAVRPALEQVARSGSTWAPVAAWLVEHDDWREAWLDALQQLAAAPAEPAPNGHAAPARRMGI